jgi:hypothetical protein
VQWRLPEEIAKKGLIYRVVGMTEGGLVDENAPPTISLLVDIPIHARRGEEPILQEFLRIVDPNSDKLVESILKQ